MRCRRGGADGRNIARPCGCNNHWPVDRLRDGRRDRLAPIGQPLTSLLAIAGAVGGLAFSLMYRRYLGVLGAGGGRSGYPAREAYDRLRESLLGGNLAARMYADRLVAFLN